MDVCPGPPPGEGGPPPPGPHAVVAGPPGGVGAHTLEEGALLFKADARTARKRRSHWGRSWRPIPRAAAASLHDGRLADRPSPPPGARGPGCPGSSQADHDRAHGPKTPPAGLLLLGGTLRGDVTSLKQAAVQRHSLAASGMRLLRRLAVEPDGFRTPTGREHGLKIDQAVNTSAGLSITPTLLRLDTWDTPECRGLLHGQVGGLSTFHIFSTRAAARRAWSGKLSP